MDKANKDFLVILALILFVLSCKHDTQGILSNSQIKKNLSYEIYNQLINELRYIDYAGTFPPPPKRFTASFTEKDFWAEHDSIVTGYKDSVLKIALNPILFIPNEHNIDKNRDRTFSELLSKMYTMQERRIDSNNNLMTVVEKTTRSCN
ncbi:hypothetical protein [uncultured Croceitalea sp.]|uniref:hypothetical protein n=1 Tax=uncultured Croceitalea sp. TaxID=1798908 RepID=UPI003305806B